MMMAQSLRSLIALYSRKTLTPRFVGLLSLQTRYASSVCFAHRKTYVSCINLSPMLTSSCYFNTSVPSFKSKAKKDKKIEVVIHPDEVTEYIDLEALHVSMHEEIEKLQHDYLHSFRIGADIKLLDNIEVVWEGSEVYLQEVAKITKKSTKMLELDFVNFPEVLNPAQTAIQNSGLNLNPTVKGTKLEVPIPAITADHRKKLVKTAKLRLNDAKENVRKIRNHAERNLVKLDKLPKDTNTAIRKQIGIYVNAVNAEAENLFKAKEKDLMLQ